MSVYAQDQRLCPTNGREEMKAIQPVGFCYHWFNKESLNPRTIIITLKGYVLSLERGGFPSIIYHKDDDLDGIVDKTYVIAKHHELNHGLALFNSRIYASSFGEVYSWPYVEGQTHESVDIKIVISSISSFSGHNTRTLVFDSSGLLYVHVGSGSNVDSNSDRARIRRFNISNNLPIEYSEGEIFADGLRNEVGLSFDRHNILWGVENGADNLYRSDLGGDIHNDNPAEELNRFITSGLNYGYPYCFTEYLLNSSYGSGRGTIWAWPNSMNDGIHSDVWCRNNTIPPALAMQAHSAPLSITFFDANKTLDPNCPEGQSFPNEFDGQGFIAYHGSWNRNPATGYKVVRVPMSANGLPTVYEPIDFFCYEGPGAAWYNGFKPVDIKFDSCNRMLLTSDNQPADGIIMISYHPNMLTTNPNTKLFVCGCCKYRTWRDNIPFATLTIILIIVLPTIGVIIFSIIAYKYWSNVNNNEIKFCQVPSDENAVKDIELTTKDNDIEIEKEESISIAI